MASTTVPPEPGEGRAEESVRKPAANRPRPAPRSGLLTVAGLASLSAGVIHAVAAGNHSEHRQAVIAFAATSIFQVAWGTWALLRSGRLLILLGAAGNAAAVGAWVLAKSNGISFIDGLETKEPAQFADTLCAVLAAVAVLGAVAAALGLFDLGRSATRPSFMGVA